MVDTASMCGGHPGLLRLVGEWRAAGIIDDATSARLVADLAARCRLTSAAPALPPPPASEVPEAPRHLEPPAAVAATAVAHEEELEDLPDPSDPAAPEDVGRFFGSLHFPELRLSSEAVLWFLGVLLVLAGSLYFTKSNWSAWTPLGRAYVVASGLATYGLAFVGVAALVARRAAQVWPSRVLGGVTLGLVPVAAFANAMLLRAGGSPVAVALLTAASAAGASWASRRVSAETHRPLMSTAWAVLASAPLAEALGGPAALARTLPLSYAAALVAGLGVLSHARTNEARSRLGHTALVYLGAAPVLLLFEGQAWPYPLWILGPGLAWAALVVERSSQRKEAPPIATTVLAAGALALVLALAPLAEVETRVLALVTALLSTAALLGAALTRGKRGALALGLTAGLVAYFFVPAPFRAFLAWALAGARQVLGYEERPLPIAYYGLTFLPYLALVWWKCPREQRLRPTALGWLFTVALALVALAVLEVRDPRPAALVLPFHALGFALAARLEKRPWLAHVSLIAVGLWAPSAGRALLPGHGSLGAGLALALAALLTSRLVAAIAEVEHRRLAPYSSLFGALAALSVVADTSLPIASAGITALAAVAVLANTAALRPAEHLGLALLLVAPAWLTVDRASAHLIYGSAATALLAGALALRRTRLGELSLEYAPLGALVAAIAAPSAAAALWPLAILVAAPVFTSRAWWAHAASLAAALALVHTIGTTSTSLALAAILAAVASRALELREVTSARGERLGAPLRADAALLVLAAAFALVAAPSSRLAAHGVVLAAYFAFAATGSRLLFTAAAAGLVGLAAWDATLAWPDPRVVLAVLVAAGHGLTSLAAVFTEESPAPRVYVSPHPPEVARGLAVALLLLATLALGAVLAAGASTPVDVALAAATLILGHRLVERARLLAAAAWPLTFAIAAAQVGALPIGLAVGAVALWVRDRHDLGRIGRATGLAALLVAVASSSPRPGDLTLPAVLWLATVAAGLEYRRAPSKKRLAPVVLTLVAAACSTAVVESARFEVLLADPAALAAAGLALLGVSAALRAIAARAEDRAVRAAAGFATDDEDQDVVRVRVELDLTDPLVAWARRLPALALAAGFASVAVSRDASSIARLEALLVFAGALVAAVADARRTDRVVHAVFAELALLGAYLELRTRSPWLAALDGVDAIASIAAAFAFAGLHAVGRRRGTAFARAAQVTSLLLPIAGAFTLREAPPWREAATSLAFAATYGALGRLRVSWLAGPLSAIAFNVSVFVVLRHAGLSDPQLYVLPVSGSLLVLGQIHRRDLSARALGGLRLLALGGAYLSGSVAIFTFDQASVSVLMAVVCAAGVVLGAILELKSYLLMGTGFLIVDLATSVVRFGLAGQTEATIVLTGLGIAILAVMVTWSLHREAIERHLHAVALRVDAWAL